MYVSNRRLMNTGQKTNDPTLKAEAKKFLDKHRKMVLTVLDQDGSPNSSLMLYATDDDFNLYFGTCRCFGKYSALKNDARVAVAVLEEEIDPLRVVDIQGKAEEIPEDKTKETLKWFESKNPAKYYVKDAEDFVMFKVEPKEVRWLDATSGELKIYDLEI